ncbi:5-(carboxyamino)imidazole ribonucleotide synthase [Aquibacillus salsiterrae]|uniref:N5-carboxyaminoimidazole ribonucleotide synthase n=1 Tax=Aquibacillus salsiterrae TaxID=2950439 RepID=A0A9X3WF04_9BACI|nr:5-(carboxyamino)imidazole ribonucleotide synthase [Aquibacillus salsiterrae]MDC3417483.1 5-(carboxyamino)imidazole ribonucleotide synthase [Aquibacillus salsiterrae]
MRQNKIFPGSTIGIIGGGQLGRMMATVAKHMGYRIVVLDPTPDCPAAQVSDDHIIADYANINAIQQLIEKSDVITYEFENVDLEAARLIEEQGILPQGSELLRITKDRENEKNVMVKSGLPVPRFAIITEPSQLKAAARKVGIPSVVKTCTGGYDGKGQWKISTEDDIDAASQFIEKNGRCILEGWVPFDKEVSVVFTRATTGEITVFPLVENEHKDHILHKSTAPANVSEAVLEKAYDAAIKIAETIGVVGTFAIEMFVCGEEIYINEMAPRPHNSGHYTIEACNVSQFEQHIRAICGFPLVPIEFHGAAVMINLLGDDIDRYFEQIDTLQHAHIHLYGKKESKPKRKMGHLTFVGQDIDELNQLINEVSKKINQ